MKAYTNLNQSKVLAYILSHDTADQTYERFVIAGENLDVSEEMLYKHNGDIPFKFYSGIGLPCWSLAALLDYIPQVKLDSIKQYDKKLWRCCAYFASDWYNSNWCDNPVDACYEMVIKLNEQKLLNMKYIEEYLKDIIKVKPLGELTTKEDELDGMSGEMVYIDGKCSNIFISHADYADWLEKQTPKSVDIDIESMVNSYKQRLIIIGSNPIVNMCLTAFKQGIENVLEELNLK